MKLPCCCEPDPGAGGRFLDKVPASEKKNI